MDINVAPGSYLVKPESPVFVRSGGQRAGKGRGQVNTDRLAEPPSAKDIGVAIPSRYWESGQDSVRNK
jgi:hypothetical protein